MKKLLAHFFVVSLLVLLPSCAQQKKADKGVDLADPFILFDGDTYYAYGTSNPDGIDVYTSSDLVNWKRAGVALDKEDSYADRWFWAPEVYKVGDRYIMYYSADEHICAAESSSPIGPFRQKEKVPMLDRKTIDNTLFVDDHGTPYMYFCILDGGNKIYAAQLEPDYITVRPETLTPCIERSQEWETESVNEGATVVKHNGKYYLSYSGNDFRNPAYGVGYATAESPLGPWTKYEANPILSFPETAEYGRLEGVGHSAMFRDKDGQLRLVFHAHNKPGEVQPRQMYFTTVSFSDDGIMQLPADDIIKAQWAE